MSVTIYEIAERAGVSSSTVARVLRGDVKGSSEGSAARVASIRNLAKEMGYRRNWRELLRDRRFDGIAVSHYLPDDASKVISESGLPRVLLVDKSVPDWSCVVTEDEAGAYAATKHLIELDHQRIAMYLHDSIRPH